MKMDFARRKNLEQIQLMVHLPDDRVVAFSVSGEKKARHVVYELAENYQLDLGEIDKLTVCSNFHSFLKISRFFRGLFVASEAFTHWSAEMAR
jgi:hypothetical protein